MELVESVPTSLGTHFFIWFVAAWVTGCFPEANCIQSKWSPRLLSPQQHNRAHASVSHINPLCIEVKIVLHAHRTDLMIYVLLFGYLVSQLTSTGSRSLFYCSRDCRVPRPPSLSRVSASFGRKTEYFETLGGGQTFLSVINITY